MYFCSLCPQPCSRPPLTLTFMGNSWTPPGKSPVGSLPLSLGSWYTRFCRALQESISQSYVSSGRSIVGLMMTSSKRSYPHSEPLSLWQATANSYCQVSTGDTQTQFCLSLCGVPGSWCAQGLFMPSEHLWQEWGLILNTNSPLLPSCWDFSFALGRGVSPHSRSSTYRLTGVSVTLDMGYLFMASPAKHSRSS